MITRYTLCARRVVCDATENDITAIGIVEDFVAVGFPLVMARLALVWAFVRAPNEPAQLDGIIKASVDGEPLHEAPFRIDFQDKLATRVILNLMGFVCPKPGLYTLTFSVRGEDLAFTAFRADAAPRPEGAASAPPPPGGAFMIA
jgi:hypothetical protein